MAISVYCLASQLLAKKVAFRYARLLRPGTVALRPTASSLPSIPLLSSRSFPQAFATAQVTAHAWEEILVDGQHQMINAAALHFIGQQLLIHPAAAAGRYESFPGL